MCDDDRRIHLPPFRPEYRASGLLLHVTSLPSPYGIGDVGAAALAWVDCLREAGQSWWQALPLGPTGYGDSPYQPLRALKARFNGAYYLDWPAELVQRSPAALAQARCELASQIARVCFAQFLLARQGERLKEHAQRNGVRLIGDLPFFVSPDSRTCGPTPSCSCWTSTADRASSPACLPTTSAPRDSSGATRSTAGAPFA